MSKMKTDTAHVTWNECWGTEAGRRDWLLPDPDVVACAERLRGEGGTARVLDVGCGVGRHALYLARLGFETCAVDLAEQGLAELERAARDEGLSIETRPAGITELPFPDDWFDYVLSFNVIYHGDGEVVRKAIAEIRRVLRPGGVYQGTMLSKRNANFGVGTQVAPDTFVRESEDDKVHPHFYCDAADLIELFTGFELTSLEAKLHSEPGSWHWHMIAH